MGADRAGAPATSGRWGDLVQRMGSGLVMVALGAALVWSTGLWLRLGVAVLLGGLMWELARLTAWRHPEFHAPRHPVLIALVAALAFLGAMALPGYWALLPVAAPILLALGGTHTAQRPALVVFTLVFFLAAAGIVQIREAAGLGTALWVVATVVQSDVLGYFVGRFVGGPKFWPSVSPKKTWSGTAAGWVGAALIGVGLFALGWAGWPVILLGPALALAGQVGDIAESWLKRRVGVKDSSDLIPGHGGLMDRFDAMAGALAAALLLSLVVPLPQIGG